MSKLFGILIVCSLFVASRTSGDSHHWDYRSKGSNWEGTCTTGKRQSPIAMSFLEAVFDSKLEKLKFGYAGEVFGEYANNGHSSGSLRAEYILHGLHFHWGVSDCDGSEHVVDFERFPLEMHMVHFNSKYPSISEAKKKSDGLAVVGIVFNAAKGKASSKLGEQLLKEYGSLLDRLKDPASSESGLTNLTKYVEDLADSEGEKYFRYLGSLTTPGCDEVVTWTVMAKRLDIDASLLAKFRAVQLKAYNGDKVIIQTTANYREIKKLNGRKVYTNEKYKAKGGAAISTPNGLVTLLLAIFATKLSF